MGEIHGNVKETGPKTDGQEPDRGGSEQQPPKSALDSREGCVGRPRMAFEDFPQFPFRMWK